MRHVPFSLILDHSMMSTLEIWTLFPYWSPMSSIIKKNVLERVISIWEVFFGNTEFNRSISYWTTLKCYMKWLSVIYVVRFDKIDGSASEVTCASQPSTRMELRHLQVTMFIQYKYNNMSNLMKEFTRGLKRNDVRTPIQFSRERQLQHLKRWFFLKNRPIHFHINSTSVIRSVKGNKLSFTSIEINRPLPAPVPNVL